MLVCLLGVACSDATAPALRLGPPVTAYDSVPAVYAEWWAEMQRCSGRVAKRPVQTVRWYELRDSVFLYPVATNIPGALAMADIDRWEVLVAGQQVRHHGIVSHEMLHLILDRRDHPPFYFGQQGACGV